MAVSLSGVELVADGNMEAAGVASWSQYGTNSTFEKAAQDGSQALHIVNTTTQAGARQTVAPTAGLWYRLSGKLKSVSGTLWFKYETDAVGGFVVALQNIAPAAQTSYKGSGIFKGGPNHRIYISAFSGVTAEFYADDVSFQQIVNASMFSAQVDSGSSDVAEASVAVTCPSTYEAPAGVAICMNANDPSKYILGAVFRRVGYMNRVQVYSVDGTTVTQVYDGAITYVAGQRVKLVKSGDTVNIFYNGVQINPSGLNIPGFTGTIHGLFNTDNDNTLGAYTLPGPPVVGVTLFGKSIAQIFGKAVKQVGGKP